MVRRKISTVFILNFAISDLILGLTIILIKIISDKEYSSRGDLIRNSLIQIQLMVSVLTNNILTTERFLAVRHPHVYRRITKVQRRNICSVSYTHLRAHETDSYLVCRLLLEKKKRPLKYWLHLKLCQEKEMY